MGGCADITKLLNSETDLHAKYVTDGVTAFGVAARHQPLFVRDLFEYVLWRLIELIIRSQI